MTGENLGCRRASDFLLQWGASVFEFGTTWLLIQKDGKCYKEDVRGVYDVSLALTRVCHVIVERHRRVGS